jgi:autotransporter-associated beta strand protein
VRALAQTLGGAISCSGNITVNAGTLGLSAVNTYIADTVINAGTLRRGIANAIPSGAGKGNVSVSAGATFDVAFADTINGLSGDGTLDNASGAAARILTVGANDQTSAFSGVIQNSGGFALALTKTGAGTLTLSGKNNYDGATSIGTGGVLNIRQERQYLS